MRQVERIMPIWPLEGRYALTPNGLIIDWMNKFYQYPVDGKISVTIRKNSEVSHKLSEYITEQTSRYAKASIPIGVLKVFDTQEGRYIPLDEFIENGGSDG